MAQALYESAPSAASLASLGLRVEDLQHEVEVFPDLWPAFVLFNALGTQWRVGPAGASGLDYGVVREVGRIIGMKGKQVREVFPDLQVMEAEALAVMAEANKPSP